jgi:CubicO group peptidase (beta-lactamase class C family)
MNANAQTPTAGGQAGRADAIESYLQGLVNNHTLAGAVTLVADKDHTVYLKAVGFRDLSAKAQMPTNAMFWIASTTKPMTATALMMLVDEGKVHLDDAVEAYLPEFKGQMVRVKHGDAAQKGPATLGTADAPELVPARHPIRIREILSHTSGLPFKSTAQPGALDLLPSAEAVASFAAEPLMFQPGTDYSYSNEGLNTAARIIEVVTGMPYEQFIQERLFDPLGMKDTTFWPNAEQVSRLAKSYKLDESTKDLKEVPIDQLTYPLDDRVHRHPMAAGGLFSTASDVSIFCQMLLNGGTYHGKRILSEAAIHEMTTAQNGGHGKGGYGLGLSVDKGSFGHGGAFKNAMDVDTATGRILVFMVQQDGPWGTADGDAINTTLQGLANTLVTGESSVQK